MERNVVDAAICRLGFHLGATHIMSEFDVVCSALNLLLCELGTGVTLSEAATLGSKVRQAELICQAIDEARFRNGIQAHQISGLDWPALAVLFTDMLRAVEAQQQYSLDHHIGFEDIGASVLEKRTPTLWPVDQSATNTPGEDVEVAETIPKHVSAHSAERLQGRLATAKEKVLKATVSLQEISHKADELRAQIAAISVGTHENVDKMSKLITRNENLKSMERDFKKTCRFEMESLKYKLSGVLREIEIMNVDIESAAEAKDRIQERVYRARVIYASSSRASAAAHREEQELPTNQELEQFERQFGELFEQMTSKSDEHRRHLISFNFLSHEISLINAHLDLLLSLEQGYDACRNSSRIALEYASQFSKTKSEFHQSLGKARDKLRSAISRSDEAGTELGLLLAKQRRYYRAVRELQDEFVEQERMLT